MNNFLMHINKIFHLNKLSALLFLLFLISFTLNAQNQYNLKQFGNEAADFIKQPAKWNAEDWGILGLLSVSSIIIMQSDEIIRSEMLKDRSYFSSIPIEFGRIWGEPYTTASVAGILALSGIINKNSSNNRVAFEVVQSLILSGGITQIIKILSGRARPYKNEGAFSYQHLTLMDNDYWSLSSGHTTAAFSLSTILAKNSKSDIVKAVVYIPALLTAFSRIYQDIHWTSDVFFGAAVGYFTAVWIHKQHELKEESFQNTTNQLLFISIPF